MTVGFHGSDRYNTHMKRSAKSTTVLAMMVVSALLVACLSSCTGGNGIMATRTSFSGEVNDKPAQEEPFVISLGFVGDVCLADNYDPVGRLNYLGSTDITDGIDAQFIQKMREMNLMWVNNEFVYSYIEEPNPGKMYTFRAAPENVSYLHDMGVDIVGLANNHTFDYGVESFLDTIATLENAGIPYVGAGRNDTEAYAPVYLDAGGVIVGYVAASRAEYAIYTLEATSTEPGIAWCYDNERFLQSVREAAAHADYVVVLPHWGVEHSTVLEDEQIEYAHEYIDAGADIVIGAHPHILQGIEYYNGKPILYSLGNFWFDGYDIDTVLAEVQVSGTMTADGHVKGEPSTKVVLHPGLQSGLYTAWEEGTDVGADILSYLEYISVNVTIGADGVVHP